MECGNFDAVGAPRATASGLCPSRRHTQCPLPFHAAQDGNPKDSEAHEPDANAKQAVGLPGEGRQQDECSQPEEEQPPHGKHYRTTASKFPFR